MDIKVGIIMGSDSDLPVMSKAAEILDELKVVYELTIVSAHRTPDRLCEYAKTAEERGIKVIIAGAGRRRPPSGDDRGYDGSSGDRCAGADKGPWRCRFSLLHRSDASLGIPVATVAINGAQNAGLLAAKILATTGCRTFRPLKGLCGRIESDSP